jgi:hypothetical protein
MRLWQGIFAAAAAALALCAPAAARAQSGALTDLLSQRSDATVRVVAGRFIQPDGSLTRSPAGALGIWIANPPRVLAVPGVTAFGSRRADASAAFMDYDGVTQGSNPDISTRGMREAAGAHTGWYLDVYPSVSAPALGAAKG